MGDWELGVHAVEQFRLADAVAASLAFPPVYPPSALEVLARHSAALLDTRIAKYAPEIVQ